MPDNEPALTFEPHRRHLTGLAYPMLGSLADAEDIVQDAYLRWCGVARDKLADPRAYLASTVARLCLDHFKSARVRREHYVGLWLPEPIVDTSIVAPDISSELADDVSVALMMTLERPSRSNARPSSCTTCSTWTSRLSQACSIAMRPRAGSLQLARICTMRDRALKPRLSRRASFPARFIRR
jgi:RNA polymerase sigma-70 factor, ECF subfamily